ncbi:hypothetical protein CYMTET_23997 [Cymbomonas tetramitiformis]|uniref:Uncharacterized protein n=1 Tax=Cymbomonas tetramitiformis TaxID=36881 RepID=A0AAE0FWZ4_9CHLO|nr:hypothetical protein CYMTET_23997 [Cymbomonas tetramitiformis]
MSADCVSLANRLQAVRGHGGASPGASPDPSPSGDASSDPVRSELTEKLNYAFAYGEDLAKLLLRSAVGLSLEGPDSETDFADLLANMFHVFGPISRDEFLKLPDLDFEYDVYHCTINGAPLRCAAYGMVLRTALSLYEESAYAFIRTAGVMPYSACVSTSRASATGTPIDFGSAFVQPSSTRPSNPLRLGLHE